MSAIRTFGRRTQETILRVVLETCPLGSGLQQTFNLNDPDITLESAFALIQSIQIEVPNLPDATTEYKNLIIVLPNFTTLGVVKTFLLRTRLFYNYGLTTNEGGLPLSVPATFRVGSNDSPTNVVLGQTSVATVNLDGSVSVSAVGGSPTNLATVATTGSYADLIDVLATFPPTPHTHPTSQITGLATVATTGSYADLTGRPALVRRALRRANSATDLSVADWHSVTFGENVFDEIGLTWQDSNRTFVVPPGISKIKITSALAGTAVSPNLEAGFSRNSSGISGASAWGSFQGNTVLIVPLLVQIQTAWINVSPGDYFRVIARRSGSGSLAVAATERTWVQVEAL
jgi:hypothetical protein